MALQLMATNGPPARSLSLVQGAGEHFLAHPGLAQEQHGGVGARHPLQQLVGILEAGRDTDQARGRLRRLRRHRGLAGAALARHQAVHAVGLEIDHVGRGIVPFMHRLADDAARTGAGAPAFHLAEQHGKAHEHAGVAGGIADLHPAHRLAAEPEGGGMGVHLGRGVPQELAVETAGGGVHVQRHPLHLDDAFQRVQLRAGGKAVDGIVRPQLQRQLGILAARGIAHAGEQPARRRHAERRHQAAAEVGERPQVQQQHALVVQPDTAVGGTEAQTARQVAHIGDAGDPGLGRNQGTVPPFRPATPSG
ncbi:MAG: hypothetical protein NVV74_00770 [Magnetospirillum sp.]|nr:hypothetical protein [Magnetospirillum sp.]